MGRGRGRGRERKEKKHLSVYQLSECEGVAARRERCWRRRGEGGGRREETGEPRRCVRFTRS